MAIPQRKYTILPTLGDVRKAIRLYRDNCGCPTLQRSLSDTLRTLDGMKSRERKQYKVRLMKWAHGNSNWRKFPVLSPEDTKQ